MSAALRRAERAPEAIVLGLQRRELRGLYGREPLHRPSYLAVPVRGVCEPCAGFSIQRRRSTGREGRLSTVARRILPAADEGSR